LSMLDSQIRKYVASFVCHMETEGVAVPYRIEMSRWEDKLYKHRYETIHLRLPDEEKCAFTNCLQCEYLTCDNPCQTLRASYERSKKAFLREESTTASSKIDTKREKEQKQSMTTQDYLDILLQHKDELTLNRNKNTELASVARVLDEAGQHVGKQRLHVITKTYDIHVKSLTSGEVRE